MQFTRRKIALGALILSIVIGVGFFMTQRGPLATPKVGVARAVVKNLQPAVFGVGTVEARHAYAVGPTQAGRVLRLLVDQGDQVQAGQLLGEIDPVDLDQRIAAAALAAKRTRRSLEASAAQMREMESRNRTAQASAARFRQLAAQGFFSKEALDAKENEADAARAALQVAQANLAGAGQDVAKANAEREGLLRQRANLKLISPVAGLITAREAEPGTTVVAGQSVLRLVEPGSLWVRARIDQARAGSIAPGQRVTITLRSRPHSPLSGKVARIELQSDSVTEERLVHVAFDAIPRNISLGELAEVTIELPAAKDAVTVPGAAIRQVDGLPGVWRIVNGKAHFVPIKLGSATLEGETQVTQGLRSNDAVIVYSPIDLREGTKVRE